MKILKQHPSLPPTTYSLHPDHGFTIIELLIAMFIIGTVVTGLFGLFVLTLRTSQEGERRLVATALANERAEMIRNLPYQNVGTSGGVPAGAIAQEETIERNGVQYTVRTDIRYIDDPFDGTVTDSPNPDLLNTDYKQGRVEVSWSSPSSPRPIVLVVVVAPVGIEGGEAAGTLVFQALNAAGVGIPGATVELVNDATDPVINITTNTDDEGRVVLPGLPEQAGDYELVVTKSGYTSEQTYDATPTFTPDLDHAHLSMIQGQLTPKTVNIDEQSTIAITTQDEATAAIGSIAYTLRGSKSIGVNDLGEPVYVVDVAQATDASGLATHNEIPWDTYVFAVDGVATGYDIKETSLLLPFTVNPAATAQLTVTLVPHTPTSLHVTVASSTGLPVDNATVQLTATGFDQSLGTGVLGQVFFADLADEGSYTVLITAPGYADYTAPVEIAGSTRFRADLTPSP